MLEFSLKGKIFILLITAPGIVRNVTWDSTNNNVSLKWEPPRINPQCVEGYQISWNSQAINTKKTQYLIEGLEPCSMFPVTVNALPDSSLEVPGPFHVSTKSVGKNIVISFTLI